MNKVLTTVPAFFAMAVIFIKGTQARMSEELVRDYFLLTVRPREGEPVDLPTQYSWSRNNRAEASGLKEEDSPPRNTSNLFLMSRGPRLWTTGHTKWKTFWCCVSSLVMQWLGVIMICVMLLSIATASGDYTFFVLHVMGNFFVYSIPEQIMTSFPLLRELYAVEFYRHVQGTAQPGTIWEWFKPMHAVLTRMCDIMLFGGLVTVFLTYWVVHSTGIHVGPFVNPNPGQTSVY
eukprot:TRINITY_DN37523_c0_g1_i5.p1 TRINITY_DN37523_c0_g1~~TRINITY_DN37523_c0_g1_i5.p1  ORF type:complete len:233 (+),score=59.59 TRINITY_DN37523_c0_g1_i5:685-1383(+)